MTAVTRADRRIEPLVGTFPVREGLPLSMEGGETIPARKKSAELFASLVANGEDFTAWRTRGTGGIYAM